MYTRSMLCVQIMYLIFYVWNENRSSLTLYDILLSNKQEGITQDIVLAEERKFIAVYLKKIHQVHEKKRRHN